MKFTLKNRPKPPFDFKDKPLIIHKYETWFEGFEKELQEELQNQEDFFKGKHARYRLAVDVLKEVLGEST